MYPENKREEILKYATVCESHSNHPIAVGIVKAYSGEVPEGYEIEEVAGKGIKAEKAGEKIIVGNAELLKSENVAFDVANTDGTTVYVAVNGEFGG